MALKTDEQLRNHAKSSMEYFQSREDYPNNNLDGKEFWKECKEISKEWLDLLSCPDLTLERIESFTEKLEALNRKDSSIWLIDMTYKIQDWVTRVCPAISVNRPTRSLIRSGVLPLFYRTQDK